MEQASQEEMRTEKLLAAAERSKHQIWVCEQTAPFVLAYYVLLALLELRRDARDDYRHLAPDFKEKFGSQFQLWIAEAQKMHEVGEVTPFSSWWGNLWTDEHSDDAASLVLPFVDRWLLGSEWGLQCVSADLFVEASGTGQLLKVNRNRLSGRAVELLAVVSGVDARVFRATFLSRSRIERTIRAESRRVLGRESYRLQDEKVLARNALMWVEHNIPEVPGQQTPLTIAEAALSVDRRMKGSKKLADIGVSNLSARALKPFDEAMGKGRQGVGAPWGKPHRSVERSGDDVSV